VISEKQFALSHPGFWNQLLPMSREYLRMANRQLERFAPPFRTRTQEYDRGLTNELAFRLFVATQLEGTKASLSLTSIGQAIEASLHHIRILREFGRAPVPAPTREAIDEAKQLADRLVMFFRENRFSPVRPFPLFPGCGWIEECAGDALGSEILFEVKAGERAFRSIDIRQLLTYCALNFASKSYGISHVCLVNPRRGVFLLDALDRLCFDTAGRPHTEVLSEIVEYVSEPQDRYVTP
jgi:hypothetical protein